MYLKMTIWESNWNLGSTWSDTPQEWMSVDVQKKTKGLLNNWRRWQSWLMVATKKDYFGQKTMPRFETIVSQRFRKSVQRNNDCRKTSLWSNDTKKILSWTWGIAMCGNWKKTNWMKPKMEDRGMCCIIQSSIHPNSKRSDVRSTQQPNTRKSRWITSSWLGLICYKI